MKSASSILRNTRILPLRRYYSLSAWSSPVAKTIPSHLLPYATAYHPGNTRLPPEHLEKLCQATGKTPIEHIAYTPTRLAWQQTIFHANTQLQLEGPDDLYEKVDTLYHRHVLPVLGVLGETLDKKYADAKAQAAERIAHARETKGLRRGAIWNNITLLECRRDSGEMVLKNPAYFNQVLLTMTAHDFYNASARKTTNALLVPALNHGIAVEGFKWLPTHPSGNQTILVHGAPGTGKSMAWRRFRKELKNEGIAWPEVQKINSDWYRHLLLPKDNLPNHLHVYYEQLTNDELCSMTLALLNDYVLQPGTSQPHAIIEHPFPSEMLVHNAARANKDERPSNTDVKLVYFIVPPEEAVKRVHTRATHGNPDNGTGHAGMGAGRYAPVQETLERYKNALEALEPALLTARRNQARFEIIDKNVPLGATCPLIAKGDFRKNVIHIMDIEGLMQMPRYARINVVATSPETLYTGSGNEKPGLITLLTLADMAKTVHFVDQETQKPYATLEDKVLTVRDNEILKEKSKNPYYALAFKHYGCNPSHVERLEQKRAQQGAGILP